MDNVYQGSLFDPPPPDPPRLRSKADLAIVRAFIDSTGGAPAPEPPRKVKPPRVNPDRRSIQERFEEWSAARPEVEEKIVEYALRAKHAGLRTYGMKAIWERLRWHFKIDKGDHEFKLCNDYTSRYARRIMRDYPALEGFFELRELRDKRLAETEEVEQ